MRIPITRIVLFHVLFQIPGIVALAHYSAELLRRAWETNHHFDSLASWAIQPQPPKIESILEYVLLLVIGATLILAVSAYSRRDRGSLEISGWWWVALGTYELVGLVASSQPNLLVGWVALAVMLPIWGHSRSQPTSSAVTESLYLAIACGILACALWILAATSWNSNVRFINDYADFPEYTRMKDGRLVENGEFIRSHRIPGRVKTDLCGDEADTNLCLHLSKAVFRNASEPFLLFPPGSGFAYNWEAEILVAYRPLSEQEKLLVQSLWGVKRNILERESERPILGSQSVLAQSLLGVKRNILEPESERPTLGRKTSDTKANIRPNSAQVEEFLAKNNIEFEAQLQLGRFFYHHAYLYLPALERSVFPGERVTPTQYGEGLVWTLSKLMGISGTPTFQAYYKIFWWGLYAYLILVGFVVWWITRDAWAGVLALGMAMSIVLAISYDALRMAPGFNPIRHLPDLLCFLAVAYNVRRRTLLSAVMRAASIGILIWWNREFGLFFLGASVAWLFLEACSANLRWKSVLAQLALEMVFAFAVLFSISSGSVSDLARYTLMGIGAPETRWRDAFGWLALWSPLIISLVWMRFFRAKATVRNDRRYLLDVAGIGAMYTTLTTIYVLWNPSPNHAAVVWLCAVVPVTAFIVWMLEVAGGKIGIRRFTKYGSAIAIATLTGMMISNQIVYRKFERIFEDHQVMRWSFPTLVGTSTAHSGIMRESVELMEKYQPKGRILMISRYDSLLQILANRLMILPYIELPGAVVSREMIDKISSRILQSNVPILFVDRDLFAEREWQVAAHRAGSLAALGQVFRAIAHCYVPGETRGALQIWHRSCGIEKP